MLVLQLPMLIGKPPPPRVPVPNMGPDEFLEHLKAYSMQMLGTGSSKEIWRESTFDTFQAADRARQEATVLAGPLMSCSWWCWIYR